MPRQPLTRGQQRPRRPRRGRQMGTSWAALAMIAGAVLLGMLGARYAEDYILTGGFMRLIIVALALVILFQNRDVLLRWIGVLRALFQR